MGDDSGKFLRGSGVFQKASEYNDVSTGKSHGIHDGGFGQEDLVGIGAVPYERKTQRKNGCPVKTSGSGGSAGSPQLQKG
jgi:hypothetical protein